MYSEFGSKELYEVSLKATDNIVINNQTYEKDEVVMFFENLQIASIIPDTTIVEASGGKDNFTWVLWENVRGVDFIFEEGLLNFPALNLLTQSKTSNISSLNVDIPIRESVVTSSSGIATLSYSPTSSRAIFAYKLTGDIIESKLTVGTVNGATIDLGIGNATTSVLIDYYFQDDGISYYEIGGENISGFFKLTSKINFVDKKDGTVTTMLLVMPKVRILSNINLTFGVKANPIVSTFRLRAFPDKDGKTLARFIYLNQDIEG